MQVPFEAGTAPLGEGAAAMSGNSSKPGLLSNGTCQPENRLSVFFSAIFMTVGILSNSLAMAILLKAYQRLRQKSKAAFLLFASGLVVTDLFGHLINGAIAVFVYASNKDWIRFDRSNVLCSVFGMSMVFFGLCPLLLGSVMAVERCFGVTRPILHSTKMTSGHVRALLAGACLAAVFVAVLPILGLRAYEIQASRTWCFLRTEHLRDWADRFYLLLFSSLGLVALGVSLLCNAVTGVWLLRAKLRSRRPPRLRRGMSQHSEMIVQLLAIMCVSGVCWSPFLVTMADTGINGGDSLESCKRTLFALRMATWNQILDPWVYILLRRAVLKNLYKVARRCCGARAVIRLHAWELSSIKTSLKVAAIAEPPPAEKTSPQRPTPSGQ